MFLLSICVENSDIQIFAAKKEQTMGFFLRPHCLLFARKFYIGDYNLCFFDGQDVFCELFVSSSISIILLQV